MLVRLGFAVASCIEPEILLVDEVLAVGDASFRQKCLKRIQSMLDQGTSIIFVSHDLNMVQGVCSSALYIRHGQIAHRGKTKEVIDVYERDLHEERARKFADNSLSDQEDSVTDVRITRIEVLDVNGENACDFRSEQSLEIRVHYHAYRSIQTANAVVRIIRSDGLTICRMRTSIDGVQLMLPQGEGTFSVILEPLQLTGGTYFAIVSIRTEMDLVRLDTEQSEWFYVSGSPLSHTEDSGFFEPKRIWKHHSPSPHLANVDFAMANQNKIS
jgi:ABC-type glutathione transport system ATPase component